MIKDYCYGVVEDRNDPLKIGRVRVRVHGYHTKDKQLIATPDLPWSHVVMPVTVAGLTPFGSQHYLVEGTTVFGFCRDADMQDFVVMGVQQGIQQVGPKETITDEILEFKLGEGFSDPRRLEQKDYDNTADGTNPPSGPRPNSLSATLKTSPHLPKEIEINYSGPRISKFTEEEDSEKKMPYYPLNTNVSDVNPFSALDKQLPAERKSHNAAPLHRDLSKAFPHVKKEKIRTPIEGYIETVGPVTMYRTDRIHPASTRANPQYPYNHATYTESGHLFELDDTRDFERVSLQHRLGTYFEWQPNGDTHERHVRDKYEVILGDNEVFISGSVNIKVLGDAKIHANGKVDISSFNDGKIDVSGKLDIEAGDDITLKSAKDVIVRAQKFRPNS